MSQGTSRLASVDPATARTAAEIKFSITLHDPSERLKPSTTPDLDDSEEEVVSDDDSAFDYEVHQADLPNYNPSHVDGTEDAAEEERTLTKTEILELVRAGERALANAREAKAPVGEQVVSDLKSLKRELTGSDKLNLSGDDERSAKLDKLKSLAQYLEYKKQITSRKKDGVVAPYTAAGEDKIDEAVAVHLNETTKISEVDQSVENARATQTITRGDFFDLVDPSKKPKSFLVCYDHSEEAHCALDWTVGAVVADGSVLYIMEVIEDDEKFGLELSRAKRRAENCQTIVGTVRGLLAKTRLQVHVVVQVCHHPLPRHLFTQVINHVKPTCVVVGSKGKLALQGVLLGSLSNYLVTNLSVPVMVVRKKLKQLLRKEPRMANNIGGLAGGARRKSMV